MLIGQSFMGSISVFFEFFVCPSAAILGLGIASYAKNSDYYVMIVGAACLAGSILILLILFCCHPIQHYPFRHIGKNTKLGLLHLAGTAIFLFLGIASSGIIKVRFFEGIKETYFPIGTVIFYIIAVLYFIYACFRMTNKGAIKLSRLKVLLRLNVMKFVFVLYNAAYLPVFQSILYSTMVIKDVCPPGTYPYSYAGGNVFASRYFSCITNENISESNSETRFRFNLATKTAEWKYEYAPQIVFCIIFITIAYPVVIYFIIKKLYDEYGDQVYKMENAGASLFKDYKYKHRFWPLVQLLYKLIIATITILANLYVPGLVFLLTFIYIGYGVLIFFIKPYKNKYNNWIEIADNGLSAIFSLLPVAAAFGANVAPLAMTILSVIETVCSLGISIAAFILDKKKGKKEETTRKVKELEANYLMEKPLIHYTLYFSLFGFLIFGFFLGNLAYFQKPTIDFEYIPTNTCVFLEYQPKMDFFNTDECTHFGEAIDYMF
ncbi:hypothetical protein TVAG_391220 [Trichomonas vaginalis G3]|uniref:Uncharacterized protein n=1 Tax=Trichomonas vaginalis (strain ATCC PRA-98 / G3) TaxID=412133 RepID=A2DFN5_TRIV3|nr:hypothetical protein TVAGG3_0323750 [Trichomonas vaginalis G3]EAY20738.1 hypothetical protein TVAG_391220 [Trichomonas vaginalis G3]KAI5529487.1 hypothetical protein TVAGG3_0323750 [Trichomonas vaginalis G3]|eukprot:XP_001581724.1 hypothetical protein [Trichomonas vaginalis G3]